MSRIVFANDMPDRIQIEAVVQWVLQPIASPTWALIDAALLDSAAISSLARRAGTHLVNAFARSDLAAFGDSAPHLLGLPDEQASKRVVTEKLIHFAGKATAVSWLRSNEPVPVLQSVFTYLAKVKVEDRKMPIHCRFADTRVLPELLGALSAEQAKRVACTVTAWNWTDRQGRLESWKSNATGPGGKDASPTLHFSAGQFRRMQRAAEPDAIFLMLNQKTPEIVPKTGLGGFHARLRGFLETADGLRVRNVKDRLQFVVLSLTCGEDFHTVPELQPTWRLVSEEGASLSDLMQGWSDALWQQLDARDGKIG